MQSALTEGHRQADDHEEDDENDDQPWFLLAAHLPGGEGTVLDRNKAQNEREKSERANNSERAKRDRPCALIMSPTCSQFRSMLSEEPSTFLVLDSASCALVDLPCDRIGLTTQA